MWMDRDSTKRFGISSNQIKKESLFRGEVQFLTGGKLIDKITTYDEYLESDEMARKRQIFTVAESDEEEELD